MKATLRVTPTLRTYISMLAGPILALAACGPFLPIGSPWSPQSASATPGSSAEALARGSVPVVGAIDGAAQVGELVPGLSFPATITDRAAQGYLAEINRQIDGLVARAQGGRPASQADWLWAIGFSLLAGGSNVFSYRSGATNARKSP